jgi:hypothetical protein
VIATEERLVYSSNSSRTSSSSSSSTYYSSGYSDYSYYDSDYSSHSNSRAEKNKIILSKDNVDGLGDRSENFWVKAVKTVKKGWDVVKPIIIELAPIIRDKAINYGVEKAINYGVEKAKELGSSVIERGKASMGRFLENINPFKRR